MKFTIEKEIFLKEISKLSKVIPTRTTLPILNCFLFKVEKDILNILSTDLELTILSKIDVKESTDGSIAVPAKIISDITYALPDKQITIISDENNIVTIDSKTGKYQVIGKPEDEFPTIPKVKDTISIKIDNKIFHRLINKTIFAVSKDELRPALLGVLFKFSKNELTAVSTDGHRLVRYLNRNIMSKEFEGELIIPTKFLNLILTYLIEQEENRLLIGKNHIIMEMGNTTIYTRIIDEKFPDYESVIPKDNERILKITIDKFYDSVKRVSIFANRTTHQIKLAIRKDSIFITAEDPEIGGSAEEKIDATYDGDEMVIGYNAEYIKDILKHIDTGEVIFKLNTPVSAGLIYPTEQIEGEDLMMLLMPIRLSEEK